MQEHLSFPTLPADQHQLLERMASARVSEQQARDIIASPEAHRQFIASLCAGMYWAAGLRP